MATFSDLDTMVEGEFPTTERSKVSRRVGWAWRTIIPGGFFVPTPEDAESGNGWTGHLPCKLEMEKSKLGTYVSAMYWIANYS